ncbi:MAG TPA: hypothetical protein VIU62_09845 [Chloroflexota bacterium]|jgi:hypothetical protein
MICRSEITSRLPTVRLRALRGQLICLLRPPTAAADNDRACALAFIASPRAPFLRRLRLYRRQILLPPGDAPRAA